MIGPRPRPRYLDIDILHTCSLIFALTDALVVYGGRDSMTAAILRDAWIYDLNTLGSRWVKVS